MSSASGYSWAGVKFLRIFLRQNLQNLETCWCKKNDKFHVCLRWLILIFRLWWEQFLKRIVCSRALWNIDDRELDEAFGFDYLRPASPVNRVQRYNIILYSIWSDTQWQIVDISSPPLLSCKYSVSHQSSWRWWDGKENWYYGQQVVQCNTWIWEISIHSISCRRRYPCPGYLAGILHSGFVVIPPSSSQKENLKLGTKPHLPL